MSDVIGPNSFTGLFFLLVCAILAFTFALVFIGDLIASRSSTMVAAALAAITNGLIAYWMFANLGGKYGKLSDYLSPVWLCLCIWAFFYLRKKWERTTSQPNDLPTKKLD